MELGEKEVIAEANRETELKKYRRFQYALEGILKEYLWEMQKAPSEITLKDFITWIQDKRFTLATEPPKEKK